MKKCFILITAVCAIITLASCSNMLEDLRKAKNKSANNNIENTGSITKTSPDSSKKTNKVIIIVDSGDKEIKKTGYVFTAPDTGKDWKNAEEVLNDSGFTGITKDADGKYVITATKNGDYTVALEDKDGNTRYEKVKVENIIPVDVNIPEVSIKKKGEPFDVTITGLEIDAEDFDADSFTIVCTDSSGNEVTEVIQGTVFTRNDDGSVKVTLTIPENKGEYEIIIECNTRKYGDVYLTGALSVDIIYYKVTFNTDGGSLIEQEKIEEGKTAQKPADPSKKGDGSLYQFQNWYDEAGAVYNFDAAVNSDITLKAKWKENLDFSYYEKLKILDENYVQFGAWPQKIKETNVEIDKNISSEHGEFTYYKGNYKNGKSAGWYVEWDEKTFSLGEQFYSDNTPRGNGKQFFKLEPVKWRVLTDNYNDTGRALLLAENILYATNYYDGGNVVRGVSHNNYEHSRVRAFLNGLKYKRNDEDNNEWAGKGFLQMAFMSESSDKIIKETTVINDARSTNPANDSKAFNDGNNDYASGTTKDKIFLLSIQEVTDTGYGFSENYASNKNDSSRALKVTDFAKANTAWAKADTVYKSNGYWCLRSPCHDSDSKVNVINFDGSSYVMTASSSSYGIVPAMTVDLPDNTSSGEDTDSYTVTFNTDGGSAVANQTVKKGEKAVKPENPKKTVEKTSFVFLGWYNGEAAYDFSTAVKADITLKAKWLEGFVNVEGSTVVGDDKFTYSKAPDSSNYWKGVFVKGRNVKIDTFYMCDHEVTQGEYEKYCLYLYDEYSPSYENGEYGWGNDYPAYNVSWYDAVIYCNLRSKAEGLKPAYYFAKADGTEIQDGREISVWRKELGDSIIHMEKTGNVEKYCFAGNYDERNSLDYSGDKDKDGGENGGICFDQKANGYRLPTEAEWEYAARGGKEGVNKDNPDDWAGTNIEGYAWYANNSGYKTHIVKSDKDIGTDSANTLGLYDMSGNVYEWCWDWYNDDVTKGDKKDRNGVVANPCGASSGSNRLERGGGWDYLAYYCSVSYRGNSNPNTRFDSYGFRLVRSAQ